MNPSVRQKLMLIADRQDEIDRLLADSETAADRPQLTALMRERADIEALVSAFHAFCQTEKDKADAENWLSDLALRDFAEEEVKKARGQLSLLEMDLQKLLLPQDPNDKKNIILEIRAGTGGDESALFAGDVFRMYSRYAEGKRWSLEMLSVSPSDLGGYKEIICRVVGAGVYSRLKFESGGHRVQRVPDTETQGRIHTSACTVAVMPEADELAEVILDPSTLRIDTFRASGAGGQHIQKTDSAVRITHLPTGMVAECQDGRSQHANKASALKVLAARIADAERLAQQKEIASTRKNLIGSGDRSERIRTYNFPQGRVTDHRINLTLYKIADIMAGDLDMIIDSLLSEDQAGQLADLAARVAL